MSTIQTIEQIEKALIELIEKEVPNLKDKLGSNPLEIDLTQLLDSLELMSIVMKIEETFHVHIPDDQLENFKTLHQSAKTILALQGQPVSASSKTHS